MIDFITGKLPETYAPRLEQNPLLDFSMPRNVSEDGVLIPVRDALGNEVRNRKGEILFKTPYKSATYNDLTFTIFESGTTILSGSLHKYFNAGAHNFNDFGYSEFLDVLNDIHEKFGLKPEDCRLQCLEVGVNIIPPVPTNDILKHCFLHKTVPFMDIRQSQDGKYRQATHTQYFVKIYNKAQHYRMKGFTILTEILRYELKFIKMERINKLGIYTLADIKNLGFQVFKSELLQEFDNILYFDQTADPRNPHITNYRNPLFWNDLLETKSRKTFYKHKKAYAEIIIHSSERIQQQLNQILSSKIEELARGI